MTTPVLIRSLKSSVRALNLLFKHMKKNLTLLYDAKKNKSTAFTKVERDVLFLRGLLPYTVLTQQQQEERILQEIRSKTSNIEKYKVLTALQDSNERLFYKTTINNIGELMPLIYTPTVGEACKQFSRIFRQTRGFYIAPEDKGSIRKMLDNWPEADVRVIVITDGHRILGLGDLGANGMGIPIGKTSLYTVCGGVPPELCMPVMFDVGTNNEEIINDALYLGYPHKRIVGNEYFELMDEFIIAVQDKFPDALIQFEDFLTPNAYALLNKYQNNILCFNDDIQGTAAVALAGIYAANRITGNKFSELRIMFLGAGSAATGIANLLISAFVAEGVSKAEAYKRLWFVDTKGLIVSSRKELKRHQIPYAREHEPLAFIDAIDRIKPHILIGATGAPNTFTRTVIERMCAVNERPVIFALSNPTSNSECTAEEAYAWSNGRAVFASGSPFPEVKYDEKIFRTGQSNNAYIFPGMGLGILIANARIVPSDFFFAAAQALAEQVTEEQLSSGELYPPRSEIRNCSMRIAEAVAAKAYEMGLARNARPVDLRKAIAEFTYDPTY